jgi:hypothetical protein
MGRNWEHDWIMAENEFIFALKKCTLKDIAINYDIPHQSVRRYAIKHKWNQKREYARCLTRKLHNMKVLESLYGQTIRDFTDDERVTWYDLACLECRHLNPFEETSCIQAKKRGDVNGARP